MTFISSTRITKKCHNVPGGDHYCTNRWVFSRRGNVFSDKLLSRSADGRLFHTVNPLNICVLNFWHC